VKPLLLIVAGLFVAFGLPDVSALHSLVSIVQPVAVADRVIGVYDHNGESPSSGMKAAFNAMNRRGIKADWYEVGGTDGSGSVPPEYRLAETAASKSDMPCVVVMAGGKVIRVVAANTEAAVLEAVK
jgi:hypothetical protein